MSDQSLKGQVALVTGSGRGMGCAIARRLAELGADVAIHDISHTAPAEFGEAKDLDEVCTNFAKLGVRSISTVADIASEEQVRAMVEKVEGSLGPISILVNNAGGDIAKRGGKPKPNDALNIPLEDVQALFDRNYIGTFLVCRHVCPRMVQRKRGSVINLASLAAHFAVTDGVHYAAAKAAIVQFSQCLALDLRPHGVRVNVISPGPTKTARFLVTRVVDPQLMDESHPLIRYGKPEDVAEAIGFLASEAGRFISGQVLKVEGGLSLLTQISGTK